VIGGFKAVEWTAHGDARGLPPSSLLSSPDANGALIKCVRNGDFGYDPVIEAGQLEHILGLSLRDSEVRDREAWCGVWS